MNDWDQIPGESDQEFAKFLTYKDLGIQRTVQDAYCIGTQKPLGTPATKFWKNLSNKHRWKERAEAYDKHIAVKATITNEERLLSIKANNLRAFDVLSAVVADGMEKKDIQKLKEVAPFLLTFVGKGQAFKNMVDSYKAIFGEKHEHKISSKVVKLEFD